MNFSRRRGRGAVPVFYGDPKSAGSPPVSKSPAPPVQSPDPTPSTWTSSKEYTHILWVHISHSLQLCVLCFAAILGRLYTVPISAAVWDLPVGSAFAASICLVAALGVGLVLLKSKDRPKAPELPRDADPEPARDVSVSRPSSRVAIETDDGSAGSADDSDDSDDEETGHRASSAHGSRHSASNTGRPKAAPEVSVPAPVPVTWSVFSAAVVKPAIWVVACVPFTVIVSALDREWYWVVAFVAAAAASLVFLVTWVATEAINDKAAARAAATLSLDHRLPAFAHFNAGKHARAAASIMLVAVLVLAVLEVALFEARVLHLVHVVLSATVFLFWTLLCMWDAARLRAVALHTYFASSKHDSAAWIASTQTLCGLDFILRTLLEEVYRARVSP